MNKLKKFKILKKINNIFEPNILVVIKKNLFKK